MQAWPSPMSITPAFSPGPQITLGPLVGNFTRCFRDDLYEQCSDHITEKTPSSTSFGSRFRRRTMRSYSSAFRPYSAAFSAMVFEGAALMARLLAGLSDAREGADVSRRPSGTPGAAGRRR